MYGWCVDLKRIAPLPELATMGSPILVKYHDMDQLMNIHFQSLKNVNIHVLIARRDIRHSILSFRRFGFVFNATTYNISQGFSQFSVQPLLVNNTENWLRLARYMINSEEYTLQTLFADVTPSFIRMDGVIHRPICVRVVKNILSVLPRKHRVQKPNSVCRRFNRLAAPPNNSQVDVHPFTQLHRHHVTSSGEGLDAIESSIFHAMSNDQHCVKWLKSFGYM